MEFALTEEQQLLQQSLRRMLKDAAHLPGQAPALERAAEYSTKLAEIGAFGALVGQSHGGSGLGLLEASLISEEIGRACAPCSWHSAGVMIPLALNAFKAPIAQDYATKMMHSELRFGLAVSHSIVDRAGFGVDLDRGNNRLSGRSLMAIDSPSADAGADVWLISTEAGLYLVEPEAAGLSTRPMPSIDKQRAFSELLLEQVAAVQLTDQQQFQTIMQAGRIALAAETLGAAEHMMYRAVEYALEREQFGQVIGSFQAVKHLCAEMAAELEPLRSLFWLAAHYWDIKNEQAAWLSCQLCALAAEVGSFIARTATEVHGGIGFTQEYGLHAWYKRMGVNRQLLGSPERMREQAAMLQGL
ncbi:MAG: acyl-CoA dehydrogenase family protein [Gammaproteobacteria bacterium]